MMPKQKSKFRKAAEQAALLENRGHLAEAGEWWNKARLLATNGENELWCEIRSERCRYEKVLRQKRAAGLRV